MKSSSKRLEKSDELQLFQVELNSALINQIETMEKYTKISRTDLISTALKRFIAAHKDYFPESDMDGS